MKTHHISLVLSTILLTACASPIEKMSAIDAVKFGNQQYFEMPNYKLSMSSQLVSFSIKEPEGETPLPESVNKFISHYGKNLRFGTTAVIDTPSEQYQMIPYYAYQSKNMNASIQFPVVFNRKEMSVYADLSALDGLFTDIKNDGKYSRFDASKLPIPADTDKKIISLMRKYTNLMVSDIPANTLIESALTDDDRQAHVVRKIQYSLKPQDAFDHIPMVMQDFADIISPDKKIDIPEIGITELKSELSKMMGPDSKDIYTLGFNRDGQIISMSTLSDYSINIPNTSSTDEEEETSSSDITSGQSNGHANVKFLTQISVSDIGKATLVDAPSASNSVDGFENLKGSLLGKLFNNDDESAEEIDAQDMPEAVASAPAQAAKAKKRTKRAPKRK